MDQKHDFGLGLCEDSFSYPSGFLPVYEPKTPQDTDEFPLVREGSENKRIHEQDTTTKSASTSLPKILTKKQQVSQSKPTATLPKKSSHAEPGLISQFAETDFASIAPGSFSRPILVLVPPTASCVFRSKVEALAGCAVDPEQRRFFEFAIVRDILSSLVGELSKPRVQQKLQKSLIQSRKAQQTFGQKLDETFNGNCLLHSEGGGENVPERCGLCRNALNEVLARMHILNASATEVWNAIAYFAYDEEVKVSLRIVGELLALPHNFSEV